MSLIAGYFSKKGKNETALVEHKVKSYSILSCEDSDDYENTVIETKFGHIIQKYKKIYPMQNNPCEDVNGNLLVTLGFMYLGDTITNNENLLELCVKKTPKILEEYAGEFVSIFVDGYTGNIHIINDRFASRPFYVLRTADQIYFSSNFAFLLYLAEGKCEVDVLGWLQTFSYRRLLETRTTFKDIKSIKPATHVTLSLDGIQEKQYWRIKYQPEKELNPVTHSAQVFEAFQAGAKIRAKLARRGMVALSGGLDSRLVAAALPKDMDCSAFTFINSTETSDTSDVRVAGEISNILGLSHSIEHIPDNEISRVANDVIILTGGLKPLQHSAVVMEFIHEMKRRDFNWLFGGGPGNNLAGSSVLSIDYLNPDKTEECVRSYCNKHALGADKLASVLRILFRDDIVNEYYPLLRSSILKSFENIDGPTAAHRVSAWRMVEATPSFTAVSPIHNHPDVTEAFCHLDYTYSDLMLRLPADWLYKRNFYSFMIYHCIPQLRHVKDGNCGRVLAGQMLHFDYKQANPQIISRLHSLANKVIGRLKYTTYSKYPVQYPFHYSLLRNDEKLFADINEILHSSQKLQSILDIKKCEHFLENFKDGRIQTSSYSNDAELMGGLANMCYSFNNFSNYTAG